MSTAISNGITLFVTDKVPVGGFAAATRTVIEALTDQKQISKLINIPQFGAAAAVIETEYLEDDFVTKDLGAVNYGSTDLECSRDMTSEGQELCRQALSGATFNKNLTFIILIPGGEMIAFLGKVSGAPLNISTSGTVVGRSIPVQVNSVVLEFPAPSGD